MKVEDTRHSHSYGRIIGAIWATRAIILGTRSDEFSCQLPSHSGKNTKQFIANLNYSLLVVIICPSFSTIMANFSPGELLELSSTI